MSDDRLSLVLVENNSTAHHRVLSHIQYSAEHLPYELVYIPTEEDARRRIEHDLSSLARAKGVLLDIYLEELQANEPGPPHGYDLLALLRAHAPWLPVIAFTSHGDDEARSYEMSTKRFDAVLSKKYCFSPKFTGEILREVLERAESARVAQARADDWYLRADPVDEQKRSFHLDAEARHAADRVGAPLLRVLLADAFPHHPTVRVGTVEPGMSGAIIFDVSVTGAEASPTKTSHWIAKLSENPAKLLREVRAYDRLRQNGVHHSIYPPMLHPGLIFRNGWAMIVYQAERGSMTLTRAITLEELDILSRRITEVLSCLVDLHGDGQKKPMFVRNAWFPAWYVEAARNTFDEIAGGIPVNGSAPALPEELAELRRLLDAAASGSGAVQNHWLLDQPVSVDYRSIHGDLHCGNILTFGEGAVLIDFALMEVGPVLNDFAQLETDLLIRGGSEDLYAGSTVWLQSPPRPEELDGRAGLEEEMRRLAALGRMVAEGASRYFSDAPWCHDAVLLDYSIRYLTYPGLSDARRRALLMRCIGLLRSLKRHVPGAA